MARRSTAATPVQPTNYPVLRGPVVDAAEAFAANKAEISRLESENEKHRKAIVGALAGAPVAYAGTRIIRCSEIAATPATPNTVITKAMVGQVIPGKKARAGYTRLEVG